MLGIIKKVNREGFGIIATAKGEKVPFVRSDVLNQQTIKPGERVVFSDDCFKVFIFGVVASEVGDDRWPYVSLVACKYVLLKTAKPS
jgi:hypothetical protein